MYCKCKTCFNYSVKQKVLPNYRLGFKIFIFQIIKQQTHISQTWKNVIYDFHNRVDIRRRYGQNPEKQRIGYATSKPRVANKNHITILNNGVKINGQGGLTSV